jgi:hypothetical protein
MTEEEYIIDASKQQAAAIYGRKHPKVSDPGLIRERYRTANLQTLAFN